MQLIRVALGILFGVALGLLIYTAGREAARRECPPAQHGERLLRTEQLTDSTHCIYASGWNSYGRKIKKRKL